MLSLQKNTAYSGVFFSDRKEIICKYIWPKRNYQPKKKKKIIINLGWSKFYLILIKKIKLVPNIL